MRKFSRLLIGLFAMQFFVAGFCLIAPVAHASDMPMASSMQSLVSSSQGLLNFDVTCDNAVMAESSHADHGMVACAHCDLPNELISNSVSNFNIDLPVVILSSSIEVAIFNRIDLSVSPATGPPLVSPSLYHTNQRILI